MTTGDESTLFWIAEAVADGFDVDWEGLLQQEPEIAEELEQMRTVAAVQVAYRVIRESDP